MQGCVQGMAGGVMRMTLHLEEVVSAMHLSSCTIAVQLGAGLEAAA